MYNIYGVIDFEKRTTDNVRFDANRIGHINPENENQPFEVSDLNLAITFSGKIYNYSGIRSELKNLGHCFKTENAAEVLLRGYKEWGLNKLLNRIDGVFALAIYDKNIRRVFLARDRLGVKNLFYAASRNCFLFSSTLKGIVSAGLIDKSLSGESLFYLFSLGYIPEDISILKGVDKVPSGSACEIGTESGNFRKNIYWDFIEKAEKITFSVAKDSLRKKIISSALKGFEHKGSVGLFLSGGLDTTILASIAAKNNVDFHTYSLILPENEYSEEGFSDFVSDYYRTKHHKIGLTPAVFVDNFMDYVKYVDEPDSDLPQFCLYLMGKEIRNITDVVITGEGANDICGGYEHHMKFAAHPNIEAIKRGLKTALGINRFIIVRDKNRPETSSGQFLVSGIDFIQKLTGYRYNYRKSRSDTILEIQRKKFKDALKAAEYTDLKSWFTGSILRKPEPMAAAFGIETRYPFLRGDIVEYALNLPAEFKIHKDVYKYIFRKAFENDIPGEIFNRGLHGFNIPIYKWLRNELKGLLLRYVNEIKSDCLDDSALNKFTHGFLNSEYHPKYDFRCGMFLFTVMVFKEWQKRLNKS